MSAGSKGRRFPETPACFPTLASSSLILFPPLICLLLLSTAMSECFRQGVALAVELARRHGRRLGGLICMRGAALSWSLVLGTQKAHKHKIPTLLGFIIRGFIWDIPILVFAYVLFWGRIVAHWQVSYLADNGTGLLVSEPSILM